MDHDPEYIFNNIEEILKFAQWVSDNFDNTEDYSIWFENSLDIVVSPEAFCTRTVPRGTDYLHVCGKCNAKFSTKAGLDIHTSVLHKDLHKVTTDAKFWDIITTSYEEEDEDQQGFDTDDLPYTD